MCSLLLKDLSFNFILKDVMFVIGFHSGFADLQKRRKITIFKVVMVFILDKFLDRFAILSFSLQEMFRYSKMGSKRFEYSRIFFLFICLLKLPNVLANAFYCSLKSGFIY